MILAGDIGGTKTRVALIDFAGHGVRIVDEEVFPSRDFQGLDEILRLFMTSRNVKVGNACFGVAGPVRNGRCETTNLPWTIEEASLAALPGIKTASLINDLEANAYGIEVLDAGDFTVLHEGGPSPTGNAALISAGTGLGEAGLVWTGTRYQPFATEGGHADFAPRDPLETELLIFLRNRFGRVSFERLLSGPGLYNIYLFLREKGRSKEPKWLAGEMQEDDPSAVISQAAMAGKNDLCVQALHLFVSLYGSEAGNLALKFLATGGVFIGGGIAPKILPKLTDGNFMKNFSDKGRMRSLLETIPVRVILNDKTALLGAAQCARHKAGIMNRLLGENPF